MCVCSFSVHAGFSGSTGNLPPADRRLLTAVGARWSASQVFTGSAATWPIVGFVNTQLTDNSELARPTPILRSGAQRPSRGRRPVVDRLQIASHTPVGEPRPPAPTRRPASPGEAAQIGRAHV